MAGSVPPVETAESSMALSSLQKRIVSGLVLAPAMIFLILQGGWWFLSLMVIAASITAYEWNGLVSRAGNRILHLVIGIVYIAVSFSSYTFIRFGFEQGAWLALAAMMCVWASDTGAFLVGKAVGGRKLAPVISPNKTWAGFGGAVAFCGVALTLLHWLSVPLKAGFHTDLGLAPGDWWAVFAAGCALGAVGQAGDLLKSVYKRRAGVKDSGTLIPGHGGLLDRIDSLMLVSPVFLLMVMVWL